MNRFLILFTLCIVPAMFFGQKKKLTHDDYDQWESISNYQISRNGNFVIYEINPQEGDGVLYVYDTQADRTVAYERGTKAQISHDEKAVVFMVKPLYKQTREAKRKEKKKEEMPKSHLVILDLNSRVMDTVKNVSGFKMPEEHEGWLAVKLEDEAKKKPEKKDKEEKPEESENETENREAKETEEGASKDKKEKKKTPKNRVLVRDLNGTHQDTLNWVNEYVFAKTSAHLLYSQSHKKADSIKGVYHYFEGSSELLDTAGKSFTKLSLDESGGQMVWLSTQDSSDAEVKTFTLNLMLGGELMKLDSEYSGMPLNRMPSEFYTPKFSKDGKQLFIETRKIPEAIEKDSMELKEEKVSLDIWSWTDTIIQPAQLKNAKREKEKGYLAVLHLDSKRLIQLESAQLEYVSVDRDNVTEWLIGEDERQYMKSLSWDYPTPADYYAINSNTGEKKILAGAIKGNMRMSPSGKYAYGYDKVSQEWNAIDIVTGEKIKLNNFKDPVWDIDNDVPALPGPYGIAGWSEGDVSVFIYTQFNIWRVDLADVNSPQQITPQEKDNPIRYRYQRLDSDEKFVAQRMTLSAFEDATKKEGYVAVNQDGSDFQTIYKLEDLHYTGFRKAKDSDALILRKGDFVNYPEVYYAPSMQFQPKAISETNPQQKDYNWGTIELVSWKGKKGVGELDGLLIKPENFDPNKKYPLVIYFYETYSDLKNYYFGFKPSASTINFAYFVSNEYIVFIPDIVYEDGHPGKSAYNCIVSGAEWLAKESYVDASKMAIQGQSWGGYQVAYLVTQTDMFACGMAGAPVSNMTSAYGGIRWGSGWSREFQYEKTQSRLGGTLWDSRDLYIENSPVFFADQVNTPLLMMHNDEDGAVPWYQGIEYFMALRRLNKSTWMLVYNKEAHNLRKRHNRKDLSVRMYQFFDHYLKGEPAPEWMTSGRKAIEKETNKAY